MLPKLTVVGDATMAQFWVQYVASFFTPSSQSKQFFSSPPLDDQSHFQGSGELIVENKGGHLVNKGSEREREQIIPLCSFLKSKSFFDTSLF